MFQLPTYQAPGQGWQLVDYKPTLTLTATADSTGTATVTAEQVGSGYMWAIQRAVCSSTTITTTTGEPALRLYDGDPTPPNLMSGSNHGSYDEADYPAGFGMLVDQGRQLTARWTGCAPGDKCTLRLQVAVLAHVGA